MGQNAPYAALKSFLLSIYMNFFFLSNCKYLILLLCRQVVSMQNFGHFDIFSMV